MKLPRRNFLHLAAGAAALPALSRIARAQAYPARPVRIMVGYSAGSASDIVAECLVVIAIQLCLAPSRSGRDVRFIARPPPRTVRAAFPHTAPTSGV